MYWSQNGKPRFGPIYEEMRRSRALFKYVLRHCRLEDTRIKYDILANKALKRLKGFGIMFVKN